VDDTTLDLFGAGPEPEDKPTSAPARSFDGADHAPIAEAPDAIANIADSGGASEGDHGKPSRPEADPTDGDSLAAEMIGDGALLDVDETNGNVPDSVAAADVLADDGALFDATELGVNADDSIDVFDDSDAASVTTLSGTDVDDPEVDGNDAAMGADVNENDAAGNDLVLGTPGVNSGERASPRRRSARQRKDSGSTTRKVALVTGASRGIGRGIALALARERWFVVVNYAGNASAADETLEQVRALGGDGVTVQADIASGADRARLVAASCESTGRIDLLINNAGIAPPVRSDLLEIDETGWDTVIDTNLRGTFFLTQAVAREMLRTASEGGNPGRIVMVSSISADTASVNRGAYCVSKAGIAMLVKLFAARLAEHGIGVHEVRPGVIETDMTSGVREKYDRLIDSRAWPISRWGHPDDIGKAVAALARGDFPFSTGDTFHVDGGWHLRTL
jgi:3-oxoacyl-[acyl-carrier protein] reductase